MKIIDSKTKYAGKIAAFLVICLVGSILVSAPFISYFLKSDSNETTPIYDLTAIAYYAFILIALIVENKIEKLNLWKLWQKTLQTKVTILSVILGLIWQLSIFLICLLSNSTYPHATFTELSSILISIFSIGLLGPFAEEMLFRKWLISMMEKGGFKPIIIVLCSSILFFCCHLGDSFLRIDTLIFAIPLCYLYIKYHDVRYCIIIHWTCNLTGVVFPLFFQ